MRSRIALVPGGGNGGSTPIEKLESGVIERRMNRLKATKFERRVLIIRLARTVGSRVGATYIARNAFCVNPAFSTNPELSFGRIGRSESKNSSENEIWSDHPMTADDKGLGLSGADARQAARFNEIVIDSLDYRASAFPELEALCDEAPEFAMSHLLKGYLLVGMGKKEMLPAARSCADRASALEETMNSREKLHLKALRGWIAKNPDEALHSWDEILAAYPQDILALKFQHFMLFWFGRVSEMKRACENSLMSWDSSIPGYSHVLGMYSFALEEAGDYRNAEKSGRLAVELHSDDLWAIHAVAHVYEMQGDLKAGLNWLNQPLSKWADRSLLKDHLWWHTALFAFERGEYAKVLELYDAAVWPEESDFYLDTQNAASLLARLEFAGVDVGNRWEPLAIVSEGRAGDHVHLFTEPHYAMAFGRTDRNDHSLRHLESLKAFAKGEGRYQSRPVERVAVPVCEAVRDFYRGDYASTVDAMLPLRKEFQCIGGSHAQRDVFEIYLLEAAIRKNDLRLALSLLEERTSSRKNSVSTWRKYSEVCERLGDQFGVASAEKHIGRIALAA